MTAMSRRTLLRASAAGAAALTAPVAAAGAATPAAAQQGLPPYVGAGSTAPVRPFTLPAVRLGAGLFREKRDRMLGFARQYDERRFLVLFNDNAGRPNPPGVWQSAPFATHAHFMARVMDLTTDWLQAGRHTRDQTNGIRTAAARAEEELRP